MPTLTFQYAESGTDYTQGFDLLALKGFDEPDEMALAVIQHEHLDGSLAENIWGQRRIITADFGVVETHAERTFIADFIRNETRQIRDASGLFADVVLEDVKRAIAEWENNCRLGRRYILRLLSANLEQSFGTVVEEDELAYIKKHVEVTGTQSSPETFTTNSGKLVTQENGAVYPTFNSSTHDFVVLITPPIGYKDRAVGLANQPSIVGGNITFQLAASDLGDGSTVYVDITIILQLKP